MAKTVTFDEINWTGDDMGHWKLAEGVELHPYVPLGFVYKITRKNDGKFYIGQKKVIRIERKPPLKGKVRKRVFVKQTDWRQYSGSSVELKVAISKEGEDAFDFEIIQFLDTKWELTFFELWWQLHENVMFREDSWNGIINVRLSKFPKFVKKYSESFKVEIPDIKSKK